MKKIEIFLGITFIFFGLSSMFLLCVMASEGLGNRLVNFLCAISVFVFFSSLFASDRIEFDNVQKNNYKDEKMRKFQSRSIGLMVGVKVLNFLISTVNFIIFVLVGVFVFLVEGSLFLLGIYVCIFVASVSFLIDILIMVVIFMINLSCKEFLITKFVFRKVNLIDEFLYQLVLIVIEKLVDNKPLKLV